jgi:hypothetical protein
MDLRLFGIGEVFLVISLLKINNTSDLEIANFLLKNLLDEFVFVYPNVLKVSSRKY